MYDLIMLIGFAALNLVAGLVIGWYAGKGKEDAE